MTPSESSRARWRPIETAPKDGEKIILRSREGMHRDGTQFWTPVVGYWNGVKWWDGNAVDASHWQPLPSPDLAAPESTKASPPETATGASPKGNLGGSGAASSSTITLQASDVAKIMEALKLIDELLKDHAYKSAHEVARAALALLPKEETKT